MGKRQEKSPPADAFIAIDHVLVGVADLEGARRAWEGLGFTVTPRGRHKGWGTANYCVMFADDYIELLGIVDATLFTNNLDRFLEEHGEGLLGVALASDDAEAAYRGLIRAGIAAQAPQTLGRLLELPEGTVEPRFSLVHLAPAATPGLRAFVCQHLTPDLVRRPAWLVHANGSCGIAEVTVDLEDPGSAAPAYETLLGPDRVTRRADGFSARLGGAVIRFGTLGGGSNSLAVAVADVETTARYLNAAGIPFARPDDGSLRVAARAATGVALTFVPSS
ncbi:MAG: VOC family protein [Rhodospirillales bacterium]|jgi:hypothetical protein|nr:VOC family protein [Rhodospirillales bacterium]